MRESQAERSPPQAADIERGRHPALFDPSPPHLRSVHGLTSSLYHLLSRREPVCSLCISTSFSSLAQWGIRADVLVLTIFTLEISHFILARGLHFQPLLKLQNSSVLPHLSATRLKLRFGNQSRLQRLQRQSPAESSSIARTQQRASLEGLRNATRNDPGKALLGQRCGAAQR